MSLNLSPARCTKAARHCDFACQEFNYRRESRLATGLPDEVAEDDWLLTIDGLQAARIYQVRGGPHDKRWFRAVQIGPGHVPFNSGTGHAGDGRGAREACEAILRRMGNF